VAALAPGRYDCRAVVRNLDDGRAAVGACTVEVVASVAAGPMMSSPLLLFRGGEGRYLNLASPGRGADAEDLSISRIFPFPAKEYVPLVGPLEPGTESLFAALRCEWGDERRTKGEIELSAWLLSGGDGGRQPIEMDLLESSSRDEADFYLLELALPRLLPGRYGLEIQAEAAATGSVVRSTGWFTVR
jgi:hypothetical protein